MGTTFTYRSGDQAAPLSAAKIPVILGTCQDGDPGTSYTFDPGDDVAGELGPGKASAAALKMGPVGRCVVCPVAPSYPSLPAVVHKDATGGNSPTGPAITVALLSGVDGANDDAPNFKMTVTSDAARLSIAYDGVAEAEVIPIPPEGPAIVTGTVDLTGLSYPLSLTGETLVTSSPAGTITFTSDPASPQAIADAYNALAIAAPLAARARVKELSTGEKYLELYTTAGGGSTTLQVDASSTLETTFGLSTVSASGTPGTRTFEWLGVEITCAAGTYIAKETYAIAFAGGRGAVADYVDGLNSAIDNYTEHPFGYVVIAEDPTTNANARALYDALRAIAATKRADPDNPVLFDVLTPTALHVASATKATNDANIATWEADLQSAFNDAGASLESVVADDCYMAGPPKMPGTFRRPAIWCAMTKRSSLDRIGGNVCDGSVSDASLRGADGTRARDDATRSTKLAGLAGLGYWCLKSMADGSTKFAPSASRAGSLDRYRSPGAVAFALEASRRILPTLQSWEGTWDTDEENPKAADPDLLHSRARTLEALVDPIAYPLPEGSPKNVTKYTISLSAPTVLDDGNVDVFLDFNPLAVAETMRATITATGVALTTAGG